MPQLAAATAGLDDVPRSPRGGEALDRRAFLGACAAVAGLPIAASIWPLRSAAFAPAAVRRALPIGLQLYTVRSLMARDVAGTIEKVAAIGYTEVEFAGYFDIQPRRLRALLDANGLVAPSAHVPLDAVTGDALSKTLADAAALGHRWLTVPWIDAERRRTLEDWRRTAALLEDVGRRVREARLRLAYHNHDFEFKPLEGRVPYEILTATSPDAVELELDLYWIIEAGGDPVTWFDRYPGRFPMVHVKDMTAGGAMTDVGSGVIDWPALFTHAARAGIRHRFVEHDEPADPLASIRASYTYLRSLDPGSAN